MTRRGGDSVRLRGFMGSVKESDHLDNLVLGGITLKGTLKSRRIKCGLDSSG
jgi:hypothetical protein